MTGSVRSGGVSSTQNASGSRDQYQPSASQIRTSTPSAAPTTVRIVRFAEPGSVQPSSHSRVIVVSPGTTRPPLVECAMSHIPAAEVEPARNGAAGEWAGREEPVRGNGLPLSRLSRKSPGCRCPGPFVSSDRSSGGRELAEHVMQDAAVHVVLLLLRRIDPHACFERDLRAVRLRRRDADTLDPLAPEPLDVEDLGAVEA